VSGARLAPAGAVLALCLTALGAAPAAGAPGDEAVHGSSAAERAFAAFRSRDFASARVAFDEAVATAAPDDVATLRFNAAVCAYQLADYADAERRFLALAEQPGLAPLALLHAGLAALGRGDPARARALLEQAPHGDAESEALRTELARALESNAQDGERKAFEAHVQRGLAAFKAARWNEVEQELSTALERRGQADEKELASVYYLLSSAALERGDTAAARRYAEQGLAHDRSDAVLEVQRGDVARAERDYAQAEHSYRRALELGLDERDAPRVNDKLEALYPVPRGGVFAWAVSGGGYDSNAAQSGLAEAIAATETSARAASAYTSLAASAGYVFRLAPGAALAPYYAFDWLLLFAPAVRELSLQAHAAGLRVHWAPRPEIEVRFTGAATLTLTGVEQSQAFSFETLLGAELALSHGAHATSLARLDVRGLYGLSGYDYLTGTRVDLALGERLRWARTDLLLSAGLRFNEIGQDEVALRPELLSGCGALCDGLVYRVPFGYRGPWGDLRLGYQLTAALRVEGNLRVEYRRYTDQSFITLSGDAPAIVLNPKTREDVRYRPGARVELDLDDQRRWQLASDYLVWISTSNVAFDANDVEHALDYDDRNFVQHVLELSLAAQF
jgi:Tfp pilus assembly protein PilF